GMGEEGGGRGGVGTWAGRCGVGGSRRATAPLASVAVARSVDFPGRNRACVTVSGCAVQHAGSSASTRPFWSSSTQLLQFSGVRPGVATVAVSSAGFGAGSAADTVAVLPDASPLVRVP